MLEFMTVVGGGVGVDLGKSEKRNGMRERKFDRIRSFNFFTSSKIKSSNDK